LPPGANQKFSRLYQLLIFDFDYTLFDTSAGVVYCMKAALASKGISRVSDQEIKRGIGVTLQEFFGRYSSDPGDVADMERIFLAKSAEVMVELTVPLQNTARVINELHRRGCQLAICTGKYRDRIYRTLQRHSLYDKFDSIVCGDQVANRKPDPEGLVKCMAPFNAISKGHIAYVGDHYYDVIAAQRCGIAAIAVTSGRTPRAELARHNPTHIISDLIELLE
jgi:phosphoglycolate phosphatase